MHLPSGLAIDAASNVYFIDKDSTVPFTTSGDRVRRISGGVITSIAGENEYYSLSAIASDAAGTVYFADNAFVYWIYRLVNGPPGSGGRRLGIR